MGKHPLALLLFFSLFLDVYMQEKNGGNWTVAEKRANDTTSTPSVVTYLTGDSTDATTPTSAGLLLMGGGTDVDSAIKWFLTRSGGGDIVVIRARGADGYNQYMFDMMPVNSVESIIIDSREKANLTTVTDKIRHAEALFIAGGDQWNYVKFWKDTPTEDAINYLLNVKRVPVGGTSAGLAILCGNYFSAENGTVKSEEALKNPYINTLTVGNNDFLNVPNMQHTITDSHYAQRNRQGRHIAFMARAMVDWGYPSVKGIGIDEQTAVCIDENGIGKVYGFNNAYFLTNNQQGAEICKPDSPLTWNRNNQAIKVYKIAGNNTGNGTFNATNWSFSGGSSYFYYVNNGILF